MVVLEPIVLMEEQLVQSKETINGDKIDTSLHQV